MTDFIILALATWRLSSLLTDEAGPFNVMERLRYLLGVRYTSDMIPYGKNELARGVLCGWCNSVWIGVFWTVLYVVWPPCVYLALPFALSAVAAVLYELLDLMDRSGSLDRLVARAEESRAERQRMEIEERLEKILEAIDLDDDG